MRDEGQRDRSWGQDYRQTIVDRFGIWLSTVQIRRQLGGLAGKRLGDFGCGYHAALVRELLPEVASAVAVDLSLSDEVQSLPGVRAVEGTLPGALAAIEADSLDVVICNNVLEHLWEPEAMLVEARRVAAARATCFFNVPSWLGKAALETAAFRLGVTSRDEIDDHKHYYDRRELWQLLVRGGFKPSEVTVRSHKLGLNTYAVCRLP